jgi:hypothetical protein
MRAIYCFFIAIMLFIFDTPIYAIDALIEAAFISAYAIFDASCRFSLRCHYFAFRHFQRHATMPPITPPSPPLFLRITLDDYAFDATLFRMLAAAIIGFRRFTLFASFYHYLRFTLDFRHATY